MGGECVFQDVVEFGEHEGMLQFHHIDTKKREWTQKATNRIHRIKLYWGDWKDGNLILVCRGHHARVSLKGWGLPLETEPGMEG
jgi:hypothetical protein